MKQTPEIDRIQAHMKPGELTLHGFLGTDQRPLVDIIARDTEKLQALDITSEQIADFLADLTERGRDIAERDVLVDDRYLMNVRDDRGLMPSPWGDGLFEKGDVHMTDQKTGSTYRWNGLVLQMIRAHNFFGGKNSTYRIDPEEIARSLP